MMIASGKVPRMNANDSARRYTCFASKVYAVEVILKDCYEDEKKMIRWRIIQEQTAVKNGRSIINVAMFSVSCMSLFITSIDTIFDLSNELLFPSSNKIRAMIAVVLFILPVAFAAIQYSCRLDKLSNQLEFLLNLFNE